MHPIRSFTFSCFALLVLAALSGQAFAAHYAQVGSCTPPNPPTHTYTTIQAAVTASVAATIIEICPGTYPEQVAIGKNLTLEGVLTTSQDAAVILPPAGGLVVNASDFDNSGFPTAAQILVQFATVALNNLTVDATGMNINACTPDPVGILYQNASGILNHVAVRNQALPGVDAGCQSGLGIYVQTASTFSSKVTVENSSVHNYNKNGITGNDPGTTLTVTGSYVQGSGPAPGVAGQNGIQLGFGATGTIKTNTVIDNLYTDPAVAAASDILLYDTANSSGITVEGNIVGNSQVPIGLETDSPNFGNGVSVTGNKVFGTGTYDAIDVCTNGNTVTGNTIVNSANSAVHFDEACGSTGSNNVGTGNTILESACAGILDDWGGSGGNSYATETYFTVPFPISFSTATCPFVAGDVMKAQTKAAHKISPKR